MKNFNYSYNTLKTAASSLKSQHFQLSGKLESGEGTESEPIYAKLVQLGYTRYQSDWQNFIKVLKCDASQRGYNTDEVLKQFPEPDLPQETVTIGETGNWISFDG